MTYLVAIFCVFGMAAGQVLFKLAAASLNRTGRILDPGTFFTLGLAFLIYATITLAWVWVLQRIELGRAYPLMALSYVLVPIGSYFVFGERFVPQYFVGIGLIMAGIVVAVRA